MRLTRHQQPDAPRWAKWLDLFWAHVGIALTAAFSIAVYFDLSGMGGFR